MRKITLASYALFAAALLVSGLSGAVRAAEQGTTLRVGGSTTLLPIVADAASGSSEMVKELIPGERGFSPEAIQVPSQGTNIRKLEENDNAFGFLSSVLALP